MSNKIIGSRHPEHSKNLPLWLKFRKTFIGGDNFKDEYLHMFSQREDSADFAERKLVTYSPTHAKAAINEIKNSIYQRMTDVTRKGGPRSYTQAIEGQNSGVDLKSNTMTGFIGKLVLPELLSMGKVGIFVDKDKFVGLGTKEDNKGVRPYLYLYKAEDILSWDYDVDMKLKSVLLRAFEPHKNEWGLVISYNTAYRLFNKVEEGVKVTYYNAGGAYISEDIMELAEIPFVISQLSQSLLYDVADIQIALLNLASADINYSLKSNYPFYVEQFDVQADLYARQAKATISDDGTTTVETGTADAEKASQKYEIETGVSKGRRYPMGLNSPGFIHPSSEPLRVSMEKQEQLQREIRNIVNLAVSTLEPTRASQESKAMDNRGLEAGLSYIGLELEYVERSVAEFWCEYEGENKDAITVKYPESYDLKSDADRRSEATETKDLISIVPSQTYQKEMAKRVVDVLMKPYVSPETLEKMHKEIDDSQIIIVDPETLREDHESGFVSTETCSKARNYPEGDVEKAKLEHAERARRIAMAQSSISSASRGVDDLATKPIDDAKKGKEIDA